MKKNLLFLIFSVLIIFSCSEKNNSKPLSKKIPFKELPIPKSVSDKELFKILMTNISKEILINQSYMEVKFNKKDNKIEPSEYKYEIYLPDNGSITDPYILNINFQKGKIILSPGSLQSPSDEFKLCHLFDENVLKFSKKVFLNFLGYSCYGESFDYNCQGICEFSIKTKYNDYPTADYKNSLDTINIESCPSDNYDPTLPMNPFYYREKTRYSLRSMSGGSSPKSFSSYGDQAKKIPDYLYDYLEDVSLWDEKNIQLNKEILGKLTSVEFMYIVGNGKIKIPNEIFKLKSLKYLDLENIKLDTNFTLDELNKLEALSLSGFGFKKLPKFDKLNSIEKLDFSNNHISLLPVTIGKLETLILLELQKNDLNNLPLEIGNLLKLKKLNLSENKLTSLPKTIGGLTSLETLYLENNKLSVFPDEIKNLKNLRQLRLSGNQLSLKEKEKLQSLLPDTNIEYSDVQSYFPDLKKSKYCK